METDKKNKFVIGVDGGGTKTAVALAEMDGIIVERAVSGISNPRNVGIKTAAKNIADGIYAVLKGKRKIEITSTFIGLPAIEEEFKDKKDEIIGELKKNKRIARIFGGRVAIGPDQLVAFRAGADSKDGIVLIAGTGSAAHGWNSNKEAKVNGWGWLADEGSAFWIGQKNFQAILKSFDGRVPDSILEKTALKILDLKTLDDLVVFIYSDFAKHVPMLFRVCCDAADSGDKTAREILISAGKEIALSGREVAAKLHFRGVVPLVLVGGVYLSHWVLGTVEKEINRFYPGRFEIIVANDPVAGAVRLAIEQAK